MKGKERVPVPVAGPAFGSGVKFVMFYVLGGFLQPAPEIVSVQSALSPVCDPRLEEGKQVEGPFQYMDRKHEQLTALVSLLSVFSYLRLQQQQLKVRNGFLVNSQELHFAGECVGKLSDLKLKQATRTTFNKDHCCHKTFHITNN